MVSDSWQMNTQDSVGGTLLEVSFLKRKSLIFLLPSPLACELVLVREVMYPPAQLLHWSSQILWASLGSMWWLLLLSSLFQCLVSDSASVCCWKRMCPEQINLNFDELPFCRVLSTNLSSPCQCPCSPLSWGDPVRHQFFYSFAASEILKLCLLVLCFFIGILVILSTWLTLQLLKLHLTFLGINVYVLKAVIWALIVFWSLSGRQRGVVVLRSHFFCAE